MIQGRRAGAIKTLKQFYPNHRVKFVLATNNFNLSPETFERPRRGQESPT